MKFSKLFLAIAAGALLTSGAAIAESTYGYNAAGAAQVVATAKVKIVVAVPKLIILRVGGDDTAIDILTFNTAFTGIPTGVATLAAGNSQGSAWDGAAPVFSAPTGQPLTAYVWTNSSGGGQMSQATVVTDAMTGLDASSITVTSGSSVPGFNHPATTADGSFAGTFGTNSKWKNIWTYSVDATALSAATPGTTPYKQTTTYTATSL